MCSRKHRFTALILSVVMTISLLTGCINKPLQSQPEEPVPVATQTPIPTPEPTPTATPEPLRTELFTKTVHDFPDYPVETFDDVGETNFIVYQKELKQLDRVENTNIPVQTDFENQVFVFENPDENLLNCQPGQTFLLPNNGMAADGFAFNVESAIVEGNRITIKGSQPALEDVLAYSEISMDIPMVQYAAAAEELSSEDSGSSDLQDVYFSGDIPLGLSLPLEHNIDFGAVDIETKSWVTFETVHLEMYFFPEEKYLYTDFWVDCDYGSSFEAGFEGDSGSDIHDPLKIDFLKVPALVPFGAAIGMQFDPALELDFSGKISGEFSWQAASRCGFRFSAGVGADPIVPHLTCTKLKDIETKLDLKKMEGNASIALDLKLFVGLKNVAEISVSPVLGLEFTGKQDETAGNTEEGPDIDFVHDCDLCIDGDSNSFAELNVGGKICLTKEKNGVKGLYPRIKQTLIKATWFKRDFYISRINDEFECDFTECPHIRYRCTVEVGDKDRYKLSGVTVTAKYEDGRTETKTTGKEGYALVYLPYGAHVVSASKSGDHNSKVVTIGKEPISVLILLNENRKIYFLYDIKMDYDDISASSSIDNFPELKQLIQDRYPNVIFYNTSDGAEPEQYKPGDIVIKYSNSGSCYITHYISEPTFCLWNHLDIFFYGQNMFKGGLLNSYWYITSDHGELPNSDYLYYNVKDDFNCDLIFSDTYQATSVEPVPAHNHSGVGNYYTKNHLFVSKSDTSISEINAHFQQATVEHIKSILPMVDAAMNDEWPACEVMLQP